MIRAVLIWLALAGMAQAEALFDPDRSQISDGWRSVKVDLGLSEIVPYRVFTLDDPRRLIVDFQGLDTGRADITAINRARGVSGLRFGPYRPGWTRLVLDLTQPFSLAQASMTNAAEGARLQLTLRRSSPADFAASAGAPPDPGWDALSDAAMEQIARDIGPDHFVVVLDPGHGGIDPGAQRGGITEAHLMLRFAREIADILRRNDGISVVLTRTDDVFVPLHTRMSIARAAGADLFISLHADALEQDDAWGASVYTLSDDGAGMAADQLVERHERGDLLAGVDLAQTEDRVAAVLMDMARRSTAPRATGFADHLVTAMRAEGVRLNNHPRRQGRFTVLLSADFPSVLVEAGFLSNAQDRDNLADPMRRAQIGRAIEAAVLAYRDGQQ
jgi:N-acetylmuramoyl-L-alanine amidase